MQPSVNYWYWNLGIFHFRILKKEVWYIRVGKSTAHWISIFCWLALQYNWKERLVVLSIQCYPIPSSSPRTKTLQLSTFLIHSIPSLENGEIEEDWLQYIFIQFHQPQPVKPLIVRYYLRKYFSQQLENGEIERLAWIQFDPIPSAASHRAHTRRSSTLQQTREFVEVPIFNLSTLGSSNKFKSIPKQRRANSSHLEWIEAFKQTGVNIEVLEHHNWD